MQIFKTTNSRLVRFLQERGHAISGWSEINGPKSWTFDDSAELRRAAAEFEARTIGGDPRRAIGTATELLAALQK